MISSNVPITDESLLMKRDEELQQQLIGSVKQASTIDMEVTPRNRGSRVGMKNENGRELEKERKLTKMTQWAQTSKILGTSIAKQRKRKRIMGLLNIGKSPLGESGSCKQGLKSLKQKTLLGYWEAK